MRETVACIQKVTASPPPLPPSVKDGDAGYFKDFKKKKIFQIYY